MQWTNGLGWPHSLGFAPGNCDHEWPLRELRFEQNLDKTSIGRVERGFTSLGDWITEKGVKGGKPSAWKNFEERVARLYG